MQASILIVACEMIPLPGRGAAGGGLRAWTLGEGLRYRGFDVSYAVPRVFVEDIGDAARHLRDTAFVPEELDDVIQKVDPDIVLLEQWGLVAFVHDISRILIIDANGPLVLENAYRGDTDPLGDFAAKIHAFQKADLVICPGQRQKAYFTAWCLLSGMDPHCIPIRIVPPALPPQLPARTPSREPRVLFAGTQWPWIDAIDSIEATAAALDTAKVASLRVISRQPASRSVPGPTAKQWQTDPRWEDLERRFGCVSLSSGVSRDEFLSECSSATAALDLYRPNSERELAITTRTIDYLWCGLPVIAERQGELAGLIEAYDAGWVIDWADWATLSRVLKEIVEDPESCARRSQNAQQLVRDHFTWTTAVDSLADFCSAPCKVKNAPTMFDNFSFEFERVQRDFEAQKEALEDRLREQASAVEAARVELSRRAAHIGQLETDIARRDERIGQLETDMGHRDERIGQLEADMGHRDEHIAQLEGVIRSFKQKLPYRLYVLAKRVARRWCIQWPTFGYLFFLNLVTNVYSRRRGPQIAARMKDSGVSVGEPPQQSGGSA